MLPFPQQGKGCVSCGSARRRFVIFLICVISLCVGNNTVRSAVGQQNGPTQKETPSCMPRLSKHILIVRFAIHVKCTFPGANSAYWLARKPYRKPLGGFNFLHMRADGFIAPCCHIPIKARELRRWSQRKFFNGPPCAGMHIHCGRLPGINEVNPSEGRPAEKKTGNARFVDAYVGAQLPPLLVAKIRSLLPKDRPLQCCKECRSKEASYSQYLSRGASALVGFLLLLVSIKLVRYAVEASGYGIFLPVLSVMVSFAIFCVSGYFLLFRAVGLDFPY